MWCVRVNKDRVKTKLRGLRLSLPYILPLFYPFALFLLLCLIFPLPRDNLDGDYSTLYLDRKGELLHIGLSPGEMFRLRLPLEEISPYAVREAVLYEDRWFYHHPGVNPLAVARALAQNIRHGGIVSGASTLTMQVARMLNRRPRTMGAKLTEMFRALQLEFFYTKKQILEIYLNRIPMGGNIEGVGAASYFYFGKNAKSLSAAEAAMLIGIPNSPNYNRPDRYPQNAERAKKRVLTRVGTRLGLSPASLKDAQERNLTVTRFVNPYSCPHLIEAGKSGSDRFIRRFSVDMTVQRQCERILNRHAELNRSKGIYNGAIIVVDNHTGEVLAYIGSPDYFDREHGGMINGADILRSPGSALKPFIYARGIEKGLITPQSLVYDIPKRYGDRYSPVNYDRNALGPVSAFHALTHSLNIPAVRLEEDLQGQGLEWVLKEVFPAERDVAVDKARLSLPLGGCPVTLEEAVQLYLMLASGGEYRLLRYETAEKKKHSAPPAGRKVLDPRAVYIVGEMLSEYYRPDLPHCWEFSPHLARAALKTGTSFGLRDAWCIGYNPDYTIGVWCGNADARNSSALIGVEIASPLFIEIFNYLTRDSDAWFARPEGVAVRQVCALTGDKPGAYCRETKEDYYIPGISPERECDVHRRIMVRVSDGKEVCPYCMTGESAQYREEIVEFWSPEVATFLRSTGRKITPIPEHNPLCAHFNRYNQPRIVLPVSGSTFALEEGRDTNNQRIALKAFTGQDVDKVFWFAGGKLIASGLPDETYYYTPERGEWDISVVDSRGRSDMVRIKVY